MSNLGKKGKFVLNPWKMTKKYENFPYPASYLPSAHKDSSGGALANKWKLSPMPIPPPIWKKIFFANSDELGP